MKRQQWINYANGGSFLIPCKTRCGTYLKSVDFIVKNWEKLKSFCKEISSDYFPQVADALVAAKWKSWNKKANCMGWIIKSDLRLNYQKRISRIYSFWANDELSTLHSSLLDLQQTGNQSAECALKKPVWQKNTGLKEAAVLGSGNNLKFPAQQKIFASALHISDVERLFSVLHASIIDRPNMVARTLPKLMFLKYNNTI